MERLDLGGAELPAPYSLTAGFDDSVAESPFGPADFELKSWLTNQFSVACNGNNLVDRTCTFYATFSCRDRAASPSSTCSGQSATVSERYCDLDTLPTFGTSVDPQRNTNRIRLYGEHQRHCI